MKSRDSSEGLRMMQHRRFTSVVLCLAVCASIMIGGCSKQPEPPLQQQGTTNQPQQGQGTADQQKMRREKRGE